ncbi:MAG: hypothetical protein GY761_10215 [Hyphomicrobiales bacterium]|nr:hypothetical protein [Hyphomicrobiales bacterium]
MALYLSGSPGFSAVVLDWNTMGKWGDLWASSHRLRHKLFIEKKNWQAPKTYGGLESDQYDDMASKYIIITDDGSNALAMARIRSTTEPYMIDEIFADHYPGPCPHSPVIWEASRFAAAGNESSIDRSVAVPATRLLIQTMIEFAEVENIEKYIAIMPLAAYRIIRSLGGAISEIGQIVKIDGFNHRVAEMATGCSDQVKFETELGKSASVLPLIARQN